MSIIIVENLLKNFDSILSLENMIYLEPNIINFGDDIKIYGEYLSAIDL